MSGRTLLLLVVAVASLLAVTQPAIAADAVELRLEPKVTPLSAYEFTGRITIRNKDVSFEAPIDYRESFSYWTEKMKGIIKEEKIEFITVTRDRAEDGSVPFRRQVPRYELEITKPGKTKAILPNHIRQAVTSKVWEGTLNQYGNVMTKKEVAGDEEDTLKELSFPFLDYLFPIVDGPQELGIGEGFTTRTRGNLPTRLTISGFEDVGLILIRTLTLKEVGRDRATFDMTVNFEADPDRPPARERTACVISGSGVGELDFDLGLGIFTRSKVSSSLTIDIEAPLRKLPTQAEAFDPGVATTRIVLWLQMGGKRTVNRLFGEAEDPDPAAD